MTLEQAESKWSELSLAIDEIYNNNASLLSFEVLYRNAYNMVLHKFGDLLYRGVRQSLTDHLQGIGREIASASDEMLLSQLSEHWKAQKLVLNIVKDILMYMDRTYCLPNNKTTTYEIGLEIFLEVILHHESVRHRVRAQLLSALRAERGGELIDRGLVKSVLSMLVELGIGGTAVYKAEFEDEFLELTREYYRLESQEFIAQNTCPAYMIKAEARLIEEQDRAQSVLHSSTWPRLRAIVEAELIEQHAQALADMESSGCVPMFRDDKRPDLARMYALFSRVGGPALDALRGAMHAYVKRIGRELIADQERVNDPVAFVSGLLAMREKYEAIVNSAFGGEKRSQKALKDAFEDFMNADASCARFLALYVDDLFRSRLRQLSDADVEPELRRVIILFRYLQDKDVFEEFYKQYLAKRLLGGRSLSDEAETKMVAMLKKECGYQFTSKLEGMFSDMTISRETVRQYKTRPEDVSAGAAMEFDCSVLTQGHWPFQPAPPCRLPGPVQDCCLTFERFYLNLHTGRKVSWQSSMGNADLRATFAGGRRHELNVSTYQMCILMLFNEADAFGLEDIRRRTDIPDAELRRHLVSLCTPKHRILRKDSRGRGVSDGDAFTFNADYSSRHKRVRVPLVSLKHATQSGPGAPQGAAAASAVPLDVEQRRKHLVEAAIVRIMKARRTLKHHELITEVTHQVSQRFVPEPQYIKKRVESLIERDYVARRDDDRRTYHYVA